MDVASATAAVPHRATSRISIVSDIALTSVNSKRLEYGLHETSRIKHRIGDHYVIGELEEGPNIDVAAREYMSFVHNTDARSAVLALIKVEERHTSQPPILGQIYPLENLYGHSFTTT